MEEKKQIEFIEEILKLKKENPDFEIVFCIENGEMGEFSGWTSQKIHAVAITDWFINDEDVYQDEDDIFEFFYDRIDPNLSDDEAEKKALELTKKNSKKVIAVYTGG